MQNQIHSHPITIAIDKISRIFSDMGFDTVEGPELEDEWHNFDALNVAKDHSSRDMQDTFWIKDIRGKNKYNEDQGYVLRTHTSNMQIRTMEKYVSLGKMQGNKEDYIAICCPGKVFRNEATDATHEAQFHQIEMLYVAKDASLAMMIGVTQKFLSEFFGSSHELKIRLRSSYFPFVEPGNEADMQCFKCEGKGCNVCKNTGWIEIGGAGMVHPKVLESTGIDSREYRGFAFGCGIDRLVMLKYGIDDLRLLYNGDLRVVNQF
ncbi:MAG: Phenylalanine--tRNA ligase [Patescibacteria group bacterium]|nr:Phenylalanine--tRNA ligase [Patescibacteria group bacterium]